MSNPIARAFTRIAAPAVAAALACGAAHAQSTVTLNGLIDISAGQFQAAGTPKVYRVDSGNMTTSFWGVKGSEDLGGGLRANFAVEGFFLGDTGGSTRVPGVDTFFARNSWVGLSSGLGSVRAGRMGPPLFVSTLLFNSFGDSFGFSPSIRQYYNLPHGTPLVGDSGWNNSAAYTTPNLGGFSATVQANLGEGGPTNLGHNIGANLLYFGGPFAATLAWQKVENQGVLGRGISAFPGFTSQDAWQLGLSYDFKVAKIFAQYGKVETAATADVEVENIQVSASIPIGAGALLLAYGNSDLETAGSAFAPTSKITSISYTYSLSKRTTLYGVYMQDKFTGKSTGNTYALGVRHSF